MTPSAVAIERPTGSIATGTLREIYSHGDTGNKDLAMKDDSGAAGGKVKSLTVSGAHNCCGQCCRAIKATVKKVEGVREDTAKPKEKTFTVSGDFDAAELVKALNAAGFHVQVTK